jgi:hypothetical protein
MREELKDKEEDYEKHLTGKDLERKIIMLVKKIGEVAYFYKVNKGKKGDSRKILIWKEYEKEQKVKNSFMQYKKRVAKEDKGKK